MCFPVFSKPLFVLSRSRCSSGPRLRVFRVRNVIYQRLVWTAVLAGALLMPFLLPFTARWAGFSFATIPAATPIHRLQAALSPDASSASPLIAPSSVSILVAPFHTQVAVPHRSHAAPEAGAAITGVNPAQTISPRTASTPVLDLTPPVQPTLPHLSVLSLLVVVYFLVAAMLLARLVLGFVTAVRLWRSATPIAPGSRALLCADLNLRASQKVSSPVTIGSGIVLPAGYYKLDRGKTPHRSCAREFSRNPARFSPALSRLALCGRDLVQPAGVVAQTQTLRSWRSHQRSLRP